MEKHGIDTHKAHKSTVQVQAEKQTMKLKATGAWILGSIWSTPEAVDAFVVPAAAVIKRNLAQKDDQFASDWYERNVVKHIEVIKQVAAKHKIPLYRSFVEMEKGFD